MVKLKTSPAFNLTVIALIAGGFFAAMFAFLAFPIQLSGSSGGVSGTPTVTITLYAGEASNGKFAFGLSADNLTSPGPKLTFKATDIVQVTLKNIGRMPHAFAVTDAAKTGAKMLFNSAIASGSNPLSPGQSSSVTFKPSTAGDNYYYICPVPGHPEAGMYGSVAVTNG
jgi:uncharacterized cupredoxin-like copper-binding protein